MFHRLWRLVRARISVATVAGTYLYSWLQLSTLAINGLIAYSWSVVNNRLVSDAASMSSFHLLFMKLAGFLSQHLSVFCKFVSVQAWQLKIIYVLPKPSFYLNEQPCIFCCFTSRLGIPTLKWFDMWHNLAGFEFNKVILPKKVSKLPQFVL